MRILHRLFLISLPPLAVLILFSLNNIGSSLSDRSQAVKVVQGVESAREASGFIHSLQRERGATVGFVSSRGSKFSSELRTFRSGTDGYVNQFFSNGSDLASTAENEFGLVRSQLNSLSSIRSQVDGQNISATQAAGYYTDLINSLIGYAQASVGAVDDPSVSARSSAYFALIRAKEKAGVERAIGANGFGAGKFSNGVYARFSELGAAQEAFFDLAEGYASDAGRNAIRSLRTGGESSSVEEFRNGALASLSGASLSNYSGSGWFAASTTRIDRMKAVEDQLATSLQDGAKSLQTQSSSGLLFTSLITVFSVGFSLLLTYYLAQTVSKPLSRLSTAMGKISKGEFDAKVPSTERADAIGTIARTLKKFRDELKVSSGAAEIAAFKGSGFDTSAAAMMIIDRDFVVRYVNEAMKELFRTHEADFKSAFPSFDADNIIGQCIDMFHTDPSHQRKMLADPSRLPHQADISVGGAQIELNIAAVTSADGEYIGNVLLWADVTEDRKNASLLQALDRTQAIIEFDVNGNIQYANENFLKATGYSLSEIQGKHHRMFMKPGDADKPEYAEFWRNLADGETQSGKYLRVNREGKDLWLNAAYNAVLDSKGKAYKVVKTARDITEIEEERQRFDQERRETSEQLKVVVDNLAGGLKRMSDGDLSKCIEATFASEYEQLRTDFNSAVHSLQDVLGSVIVNAQGIRTGASEISQAADDLSRRTENQAATLEETAASLEEITASVRAAAEGAEQANQVVLDAKKNAETSGVVVREAVGAMSEIEKSSQQISQIIGVIDDIAFQTNLLALNAGVEAARAGDAGRGFAVVASEVRALAQRSSDAAKEIKTLISESGSQVEKGVDLVGQTGKALEDIVESVSSISTRVSEIARSAREQSTGIAEINVAMNQMDQVTQQNAAMVEQSTAASHSLNQESEELGRLVSKFNTGGNYEAAAASLAATPSAAPAASAPAPAVHNQQKRVASFAASQPAGGGAAAAAQSVEDDWEDF